MTMMYRRKSPLHPEVVDVHQQQQENSLASIHLPRDVSADVHSAGNLDDHAPSMQPSTAAISTSSSTTAAAAATTTTNNNNFLSVQRAGKSDSQQDQRGRAAQRSPHRSPQRSPQKSPQHSPSRSPLPSPQRAAANALSMLSQLSARTSPRNLSFLKPNIRVNLSSFNPMRQLLPLQQQQQEEQQQQQQQNEDDKGAGSVDGVDGFAAEAPVGGEGPVDGGKEEEEAEEGGGGSLRSGRRRRSADFHTPHLADDDASTTMKKKSDSEGETASGEAVVNNRKPEGKTTTTTTTTTTTKPEPEAKAGAQHKVMVRLKKDWQEISLDSCGILATSPTHLLMSSFKWDQTVRRSLDLDLDDVPDHGGGARGSPAAEPAQPSARLAMADNGAGADTRFQAEAKVAAVSPDALHDHHDDDGGEETDKSFSNGGGGSGGGGSSAVPDSQGVVMRRPTARRLHKSSSAEDVGGQAEEAPSDEDSYCVLDEAEVAAFLRKSQQLQHPHMKTSLSDNALTLQQQHHHPAQGSVSVTSCESSPFSRLKVKMSTLTVLRSSNASSYSSSSSSFPSSAAAAAAAKNQNILSISKSHIRKSQRAMDVFERLVLEKLRGSECQSRIIFI